MGDRFSEADRLHRYRPEQAGEELLAVFCRAILGDDDKALLETRRDGSIILSGSKKTLVDKDGNLAFDAVALISGTLALERLPGSVQSAATYAFRDNKMEAQREVDRRIENVPFSFTNLAGTGTANLFSAYDGTTKVFVRNLACWTAGFDLSAVSAWNSANADGTGGNRGCVTIVAIQGTTAQALTNRHFTQIYQLGVQHAFVDTNGQTVLATVVAGGGPAVPDTTGTLPGRDIQVVYLQFLTVPAITPARVFAPGVAAKAFPAGTPLLSFNQQKQAVVTELDGFSAVDSSVGLRMATTTNRIPWSVSSDAPGYSFAPGRMGDSDSPSFVLTGAGPGLLTSYYTPSGGYSLGDFATQINALLPAGVTVATLPINVLGTASKRDVVGPAGPLVAVDPVTQLIPAANIPPLSAVTGQIQTWDGLSDTVIPLTTATFQTQFASLDVARSVTIAPGSQAGRQITLLLQSFSGSGSWGVSYQNSSGVVVSSGGFSPQSQMQASTQKRYLLTYVAENVWTIDNLNNQSAAEAVSGRRSAWGLDYAPTVTVDFNGAALQQIYSLTGDVTIATANIRLGRTVKLCIKGDSVDHNVIWPQWRSMNTAPAVIPAGKWVEVDLTAWGNNTPANVSARYIVQIQT